MSPSNTVIFESVGKNDLPELATRILKRLADCRVFLLRGNLGAGKTTIVQAFCDVLGYTGHVTSPTFSIVNSYEAEGQPVFHMDLYRLESVDEAFDIGIEDYIHSGGYCFIEWPDIYVPFLYPPYAEIGIENTGNDTRKFTVVWNPGENL